MPDWIDLTHPMNADMPIYGDDSYADPAFAATPWSRVETEGFAVWHLQLGTQTGTHIDAPSHFRDGAPTLDALDPGDCIGRYCYVPADALAGTVPFDPGADAQEKLLFLDARAGIEAPKTVLEQLLGLPARVWIMAGTLTAQNPDPFWLNRALADARKFLIEDLNLAEIDRVTPSGEAIAVPLRLSGLSGSPVRVLIRNKSKRA